jgi:hypothetical protein
MSEEFVYSFVRRLEETPTSRWRKEDWINAAKLIEFSQSKTEPDEIIFPIIVGSISEKIRMHGSDKPKVKGGRPNEISPEYAKEFMLYVGEHKEILANKLKLPLGKITDKQAIQEIVKRSKKAPNGMTNSQKVKYLIGHVKHLKKIIQSGN